MKNTTNKYIRLSHELALKQLLERFIFEMEVNKELFKNNNSLTLDYLINESHNIELFSNKEYIDIYNKAKKIFKNK